MRYCISNNAEEPKHALGNSQGVNLQLFLFNVISRASLPPDNTTGLFSPLLQLPHNQAQACADGMPMREGFFFKQSSSFLPLKLKKGTKAGKVSTYLSDYASQLSAGF